MEERGPSPAPAPGARGADASDATRERPARARAAEDASAEPAEPQKEGASDVQSVLGGAVERLARETGAERVAAWRRGAAGGPTVLAARSPGSGPALRAPEEAAYAALARLDGATALAGAARANAALARVAHEQGLRAAAPVWTGAAEPEAVLLLGGGDAEAEGAVRPRSLAALDGAARRLAGPLAAAAATERLARLDAYVRRLDRLASLGSLVVEIVHEIRNPLVSVKTFLQLLPERAAGDGDFRGSFLEVASDELRRVERLLDVVLQHGRPAPPARSDAACAPRPALDSVARLVSHRAAERGVEVAVDAHPELPEARIAPDGLRQVVLNLVLNALEVTPEGGRVRLLARRGAGGAERPIELRVEDEGPGVPREIREQLFEPFYSTKGERPGGLGLAITRRIVEEAGGTIGLEKRRAGGSAFRVRLREAEGASGSSSSG